MHIKFLYSLLLLIISGAYNTLPAQLPLDSIKAILKEEIMYKRSKGIVAGTISAKGSEIYGYGKVRDDSDVRPDGNTLYEIGSVTKVFTSLLLADMVQKGEMKLEDPIAKYLPETVKVPVRNGKEITLLQLATHTSGFPREADNPVSNNPDDRYAGYTIQMMYDFISGYQLTRDPGSKYEYSSFGMGLLGHILSVKAGKSFDSLLQERICKRLKMETTLIRPGPELKSLLASGHNAQHQPVASMAEDVLGAAGNLKSDVNDLLKFLSAEMGLTKDSLYPAMELTQSIRDSTDERYKYIGLGWHILKKGEKEICMHSGGTPGYRSFILFDKKNKIGVVVLSNSAIMVDDIAFRIAGTGPRLRPTYYPWLLKDTVMATIKAKGINAAVTLYKHIRTLNNPRYIFNEDQLNILGYELYQMKKMKAAIALLKLNTEEYPLSWNSYDTLGEVYAAAGHKELAIASYEKSLTLNPDNKGAIDMLAKLKKH